MRPSRHDAPRPDTRTARRSGAGRRIDAAPKPHWLTALRWLAALAAAAGGVWIAAHHPLSPWVALTAFGLQAALAFASPSAAWVVAFAALPLVDLAPWTGWISFEEVDLVMLATAAGGYARLALPPPSQAGSTARSTAGRSALAWLVAALFGGSVLLAALRGFDDAGGFTFGWYQGLHEPMNSLRLAKPYALALLLVPIWNAAASVRPATAAARLNLGLTLGLGGAALAAIWERAAFTGLLDFSTDYRTTALFWEMNVGGAALDGFLALTVPFALRELLTARTPLRWGWAAAVGLAGAYACVTTFSRGVYLAIPAGLAVFAWLHAAQARRAPRSPAAAGSPEAAQRWPSVVLVAGFGLAGAWMFPTSGYRGLLALLGAAAILLRLAGPARRLTGRDVLLSSAAGVALAAIGFIAAAVVAKGAYALYAFGWLVTAALLVPARASAGRWSTRAALAGFAWLGVGLLAVARHWGEAPALRHALPAAFGLAAVLLLATGVRRSPWPASPRWQGSVLASMIVLVCIIGVQGGGTYMADRFATGGADFEGRLQHWREGLAMLRTPAEQAFGKGLGRYPSNLFFSGATADQTGDYRIRHEGANNFLALTGGKFEAGWGEIFRVSQRVGLPALPVTARFDVRAARPVSLLVEVCEKQLLYNADCAAGGIDVTARPGEWQPLRVALRGEHLGGGPWYAPRLLMFSIGVASNGGAAEVDNIDLVDANGRHLLANGDFSADMARWFFSSDRYHLAWHIKSLYANVLFDQGAVGLVLLALLAGAAVGRLAVGAGRDHPLAPACAAALVGFGVVGLFDSLLDVPRVAFVFYFLLLVSLTLRRPRVMTATAAFD